jgi:integrase
MARKSILDEDRFTFKVYLRTLPKGDIYYARFYEKGKTTLLADRSTGERDESRAKIAAGKLLAQLPLDTLARSKNQQFFDKQKKAEGLKNMSLANFLVWFWDVNVSDYIKDRNDAEKSLAGMYVKNQYRYVTKHAATYSPFKKTALRDTTLYLIEQWMHHLKRNVSNNVVVDVMSAARTPLSWAKKRNLMDDPPDWAALVKPKEHHKKRGILTRTEVAKIIALPTLDMIKPRPRLKNGKKNEGPAPIDIRMKAIVLLSELAALRRGEIRALRWQSVHFNTKLIDIMENYTDMDGIKGPKLESIGVVPMADELGTILTELKQIALKLTFDKDDDFVIFNTSRGKPVAESTIKRGFHRALALIGIEDDSTASKEKRLPCPGSQQARRLVLHSGRHGAATRLAEAIGPRAAAKVTRHRSAKVFKDYTDHDTDEALERARKALSVTDQTQDKKQ